MHYFYETQPNPNPLSYFAHQAPGAWHQFETFGNHVVELASPWLAFVPLRAAGMANGCLQILFQMILISTGNLSFLNWLTVLPSIWFFDDKFLAGFFSLETVQKVAELQQDGGVRVAKIWRRIRQCFHLVLALTIGYLSLPIVVNLLSANQVMNTSFEPFRIVNTYGAFGSVTKERNEVILEGTYDKDPENADWKEYEFHCKPGNVSRAPCLISPFHYRLDWLMWFAGFQSYEQNPWLVHLAGKMLENDQKLLGKLIHHNPFEGQMAPTFVRASHYRYRFTKFGKSSKWWKRKRLGEYMPPFSINTIRPVYKHFGWKLKNPDIRK